MMRTDADWMAIAIEESRRGLPAPNPHVGCVIVKDGRELGRGHHPFAGAPHAEVNALAACSESPKGATAYVTLEPCNHTGRTGPCSLALIEAGIRRVVIAVADPNPTAAGGISRLQEAGIETEVGLLADEAAAENRQFLASFALHRPFVTLKAAASLDGRIALPSGESKWITGPEARADGRRLRAECGAVLVGRRTVEQDDPLLTPRLDEPHAPVLRIVFDPEAKLGSHYRVFDDSAPTWHVTGAIDLADVLDQLARRGHRGVLVEGGSITISRFVQSGFADRLVLYSAPKLLGDGPSWLASIGLGNLADGPQLDRERTAVLGPDLKSTFLFRR